MIIIGWMVVGAYLHVKVRTNWYVFAKEIAFNTECSVYINITTFTHKKGFF